MSPSLDSNPIQDNSYSVQFFSVSESELNAAMAVIADLKEAGKIKDCHERAVKGDEHEDGTANYSTSVVLSRGGGFTSDDLDQALKSAISQVGEGDAARKVTVILPDRGALHYRLS